MTVYHVHFSFLCLLVTLYIGLINIEVQRFENSCMTRDNVHDEMAPCQGVVLDNKTRQSA